MKVKDLIKELKWCDQDLQIFVHFDNDIHELHSIDATFEDRVDINLVENEDRISVPITKDEVINWLGSDWSFDNIVETLQELANRDYQQKQLREDIKSSQND